MYNLLYEGSNIQHTRHPHAPCSSTEDTKNGQSRLAVPSSQVSNFSTKLELWLVVAFSSEFPPRQLPVWCIYHIQVPTFYI